MNDGACRSFPVRCSDVGEHRRRIETRAQEVPGLERVEWRHVLDREYHPWESDRIVVDTAGRSVDESFRELLLVLGEREDAR